MGRARVVGVMVLAVCALVFLFQYRTPFVIQNPAVFNPLSDSVASGISSPNRINESQIEITDDTIIIHFNHSLLSRFGNTSSMLPTFDDAANGILFRPEQKEDIRLGDIIAFEQEGIIIIHRVIALDSDSSGWYAITKGDNNANDDGKIRFTQIKYVLIALVY